MNAERRPIPSVASEPVDRLLSIGVFARRSRLSMKALRLYDLQGLLMPAHIDQGSGYRRIAGASWPPVMRRESAHHEAYVRLKKAQVEYPQILSAYGAVAQWISSHGLTATGSPRAVYFTDFNSAGPSDEVCDVAFPVEPS